MRQFILTLCSLVLLPSVGVAARIPLRYIGGRVCVRVDLHTDSYALPVTLIVDMGLPVSAVLDEHFVASLEINPDEKMSAVFSDKQRFALSYRTATLDELGRFTRRYAAELEDVPAVGIIGLSAFGEQKVLLDIQDGFLQYSDMLEADPDWHTLHWLNESFGLGVEALPTTDYRLRAGITTGSYETWIDAICAAIAGFPDGRFERFGVGDIGLDDFSAIRLRPSVPSGSPDVRIGNSFWQNFRILADPENQTLRLREKQMRLSDLSEQDYFAALINEDVDAVEAWLNTHHCSRLAGEAAAFLLEQRLEQSPFDGEAVDRACNMLVRVTEPERAAEILMSAADRLYDQQRYEGPALSLLLKYAGECVVGTSDYAWLGYDIHGRKGRYAVQTEDWPTARLHLLSALFGRPADPFFNYWMGRYHEANDQPIRAWSRYLRAATAQRPLPEAVAAIGRMNNDADFRGIFSIRDAQDFLNGRLTTTRPAVITGDLNLPALTLIELFGDKESQSQHPLGALSAAAAMDQAIVVNYVIGSGMNLLETRACGRAAQRYGVNAESALVVNGSHTVWNAEDFSSREAIIELVQGASLQQPLERVCFDVKPSADSIGVAAVFDLSEIADAAYLDVVVVQRRCLMIYFEYTGIYRNVARAMVSRALSDADPERVAIAFDFEQIQTEIQDAIRSLSESTALEVAAAPSYIDMGDSFLVAKVFNRKGQLIAAGSYDLGDVWRASYAH